MSQPEFIEIRFPPSQVMGWMKDQPIEDQGESVPMREIRQYVISTNETPMRWDVAWINEHGQREQYALEPKNLDADDESELWRFRLAAHKRFKEIVPREARIFILRIPRAVEHVMYWRDL